MHIFITIFALTYGQMDLFFSTKGAIITEAFSHTFLHDLLKIPQLVCHLSPTLLLLLLELLKIEAL